MNKDAIVQLTQFGFLAVTGRDAQKFLQGYTTCDLEQIPDDQAMRGAICNIKGRMLTNFIACRRGDGFLLRLDRGLVEPTVAFLSKYIVFSKAKLEDLSESLYCFGLLSEKLTADLTNFPQALLATTDQSNSDSTTHFPSTDKLVKVGHFGWELWTDRTVEATGKVADWQALELETGIVWVTQATSEEYLPQMFNLHNINAISFDKGCYLGQEIVARMQYRGELKKRLHFSTSPDGIDPKTVGSTLEVNAKILNQDGNNIGNIVALNQQQIAMVIKAGETAYSLENGVSIEPKEIASET